MQLALLVTLTLGTAVIFLWRRNSRLKQRIAQRMAEAKELEQFVLARLDSIGQLIEDPSITAEELRRRSEAIISEMQSRNTNGLLDALISDVKGSISAEIGRRQAA